MTTYLGVLNGISWGALLVLNVLIWSEALGRPRAILCDCRIFPNRLHHLDTPYLLIGSIVCGIASVTSLVPLVFENSHGWKWVFFASVAVYALWSLSFYRRWKKHKRGGKHGALAKLLAKVKITAVGLRVVPVPGGNR